MQTRCGVREPSAEIPTWRCERAGSSAGPLGPIVVMFAELRSKRSRSYVQLTLRTDFNDAGWSVTREERRGPQSGLRRLRLKSDYITAAC